MVDKSDWTITSGKAFEYMKNALTDVKSKSTLGKEYFDYYEFYLVTTYVRRFKEFKNPSFSNELVELKAQHKPTPASIRDEGYSLLPKKDTFFYMQGGKQKVNAEEVKQRLDDILSPIWGLIGSKPKLKLVLSHSHGKVIKSIADNIVFNKEGHASFESLSTQGAILKEFQVVSGDYSSILTLVSKLDGYWSSGDIDSRKTLLSRFYTSNDQYECKRLFYANVLFNYLVLKLENQALNGESEFDQASSLQLLNYAFERELSLISRLNIISRLFDSGKWNELLDKYSSYKNVTISSARQWIICLVEYLENSSAQNINFETYLKTNFEEFISSPARLSKGLGEKLFYDQVPKTQLSSSDKKKLKKFLVDEKDLRDDDDKDSLAVHGKDLLADWGVELMCNQIEAHNTEEDIEERRYSLYLSRIESIRNHKLWQNTTYKAKNIWDRLHEWLWFLILRKDYEAYTYDSFDDYLEGRANEFLSRCCELISDSEPEAGDNQSDNYYFNSFRWDYVPFHYRRDRRYKSSLVNHKQFSKDDVLFIQNELRIVDRVPPANFLKQIKQSGSLDERILSRSNLNSLWEDYFQGEDEILFVLFTLYYPLFVTKREEYQNVSDLNCFWDKLINKNLKQKFSHSVKFFGFVQDINEFVLKEHKQVIAQIDQLKLKPYEFKHGSGQNSKLGTGASGTVYRCFDNGLQRDVAIKFIVPALNNAHEHEKLKEEARILASIRHKYIVNVYNLIVLAPEDYELSGNALYAEKPPEVYGIVMEYIPDPQTLDCYLESRANTLSLDDKIDLFQRICHGVQAVHNNTESDETLCHGDIKLGNILVDKNGSPKLIDFGLSSTQGSSQKGLGSLNFSSERRFQGGRVCVSDDLFSLGILLLHILVGSCIVQRIETIDKKRRLFIALSSLLNAPVNRDRGAIKKYINEAIGEIEDTAADTEQKHSDLDCFASFCEKKMFLKTVISAIAGGFEDFNAIKQDVLSHLSSHSERLVEERALDFGFSGISPEYLGSVSNAIREVKGTDLLSIRKADLFGQELTKEMINTFFEDVSLDKVLEWKANSEAFDVKLVAIDKTKQNHSGSTENYDDIYVLISRDNNTRFFKVGLPFPSNYKRILNNYRSFSFQGVHVKQLVNLALLEQYFIKVPILNYAKKEDIPYYNEIETSHLFGTFLGGNARQGWLDNLYSYYNFADLENLINSSDFENLKLKLEKKLHDYLSEEIKEWSMFNDRSDKYWSDFIITTAASSWCKGDGTRIKDYDSLQIQVCCEYIASKKVSLSKEEDKHYGIELHCNDKSSEVMALAFDFVEFLMIKDPRKLFQALYYINDLEIFNESSNWPCFLHSDPIKEMLQVNDNVQELDLHDIVSRCSLVEILR